jgi:uncharacterized GH25 family protein
MKLFNKMVLSAAVASVIQISSAQAHSLWVNSFESFTHKPGHTTVGLGWGHTLPVDDVMNSSNAKMIAEKFTITSPDGKVTNLRLPTTKSEEPIEKTADFDVYGADLALQKIVLKEDSKQGVYKIEALSKPTAYTQFIDKKGHKRLKMTTMDKITDIKKVLMSVKHQAFAKSYLTIGKWTEQKAANKGLEIIPKTDLTNVRVGDLVEFEVLFHGKPLNVTAKSMDYITALSDSFGQNDGFSLMSYIKEGKAQIRVQSAGQWIVSCSHRDAVTNDGPLKDLVGKVNFVFNAASLTFNVKE